MRSTDEPRNRTNPNVTETFPDVSDDGDITPTSRNDDVVVTFSDVNSTSCNNVIKSDVTAERYHNVRNDVEAMQTDEHDADADADDTDTDTIILDSDEDLELVQRDEISHPPPEVLSPLKSLDTPQLIHTPAADTGTTDGADGKHFKTDNLFKVPRPVDQEKRKPQLKPFLEGPKEKTNEIIVASAGGDLSSFRSHQKAPLSQEFHPIRRVRRYNSEPYRSLRNRKRVGSWRSSVLIRKSSPRRRVPQNRTADLQQAVSHIWFKPGMSHPLLKMDSNHVPKFLKRRIQRQRELESRGDNRGNSRSGVDVKFPCFHCGCPGNHMPKFMKKRLLRKLNTAPGLGKCLAENMSIKGGRLLHDMAIDKLRIDTQGRNVPKNRNDVMITESGSDGDLETRINRMRRSLLKRQSRMEVLERVMYRRKPQGVFIASLMRPKHRMLKPNRR